jgi:dimethylargininase
VRITRAITRDVSERFAECALTFLEREAIDVELAQRQHHALTAAVARLQVEIVPAPAMPDLPDASFVEDTAVVLDELAVIAAPALGIRRQEVASVAQTLARYRPLHSLSGDACLEGGDVLRIGRTLFTGLSTRTNREGARQLEAAVAPYGYEVRPVEFGGCLHLKSACTSIGRGTLLANPAWVDTRQMGDQRVIEVDSTEPGAANALTVESTIIFPASYPGTRGRLESAGFRVEAVDISELQKAEAGVTCSFLLLDGVREHGVTPARMTG